MSKIPHLRVSRGLNSIIHGRALTCAWPLVSAQEKTVVATAAAAVCSIIQGAGGFKYWFFMGRRFASKGHLTMETVLIVPTWAGWGGGRATDIYGQNLGILQNILQSTA